MGIAKRMHSKYRMGGVWRGYGNVDLLGAVGVHPDGTIYLKVRAEKPPAKVKRLSERAKA